LPLRGEYPSRVAFNSLSREFFFQVDSKSYESRSYACPSMNATQAKDRLYGQLAASLKNMSRAVGQTADLFEQLQTDLDAMRVLAGTHAAQ
jgi:hypothetical protein